MAASLLLLSGQEKNDKCWQFGTNITVSKPSMRLNCVGDTSVWKVQFSFHAMANIWWARTSKEQQQSRAKTKRANRGCCKINSSMPIDKWASIPNAKLIAITWAHLCWHNLSTASSASQSKSKAHERLESTFSKLENYKWSFVFCA